MKETLTAHTKWTIEKFKGNYKTRQEAYQHEKPYAVDTFEGNVLLNEGIAAIWDIVCGLAQVTLFDANNAHLGVGNSSTAESANQTGLLGPQVYYKQVDSAPVRTGNKISFTASFGDTEANFGWYEFTVANGSSNSAVNLNRKVSYKGTKTGGTWILTCEITLT